MGQKDARLDDPPSFDPARWDQVPSVERSLRAQLIEKVIAQVSGTTGWDPGWGSPGEGWTLPSFEDDEEEEDDEDDDEDDDDEQNQDKNWDWGVRDGLAGFLDFIRQPWRIPTEDELVAIGARLPTRKRHMTAMGRDTRQSHNCKFTFSAAAAAIHFLGLSVRKHKETLQQYLS